MFVGSHNNPDDILSVNIRTEESISDQYSSH